MKFNQKKMDALLAQIDLILNAIQQEETAAEEQLGAIAPRYYKSARNLVHYNAFRKFDLRVTQKRLRNLGLTRFANAESHIRASLLKTKFILETLQGEVSAETKAGLSIKNGKRLLTRHTKELLGYRSKGRRVRIMVTQPTQAAYDYPMVLEMVKNGMNCARVNCAHDNPEVWKRIIDHVHKAAEAVGRNVKITMDLAGPKIRTGRIAHGPRIRKFTPERDVTGKIVHPALIEITDKIDEFSEPNTLVMPPEWLNNVVPGDEFSITDTRYKKRKLKNHLQRGDGGNGPLLRNFIYWYWNGFTLHEPSNEEGCRG